MGEVNLSLNGKSYGVACDDGQERRVSELGKYVDSRLREIAGAGAASSEAHLLVLTSLVMADEVHELRNTVHALRNSQQRVSEEDESQIIDAINHLALRIDSVADRLKAA